MLYGRIQTTFIQDISASAPGDLGVLAIGNGNNGRTTDDNQEQEVQNNYQSDGRPVDGSQAASPHAANI